MQFGTLVLIFIGLWLLAKLYNKLLNCLWKPEIGDVVRFSNALGSYTYTIVTKVWPNGDLSVSSEKFNPSCYSSQTLSKSDVSLVRSRGARNE